MTIESAILRADIRSGDIACRCKQRPHHPGCLWAWAVQRVYDLERAEAALDTVNAECTIAP